MVEESNHRDTVGSLLASPARCQRDWSRAVMEPTVGEGEGSQLVSGLPRHRPAKHPRPVTDKKAGKQSWNRRTLKATIDNKKLTRTSFGPEYSSDNAGDGPVGKTVRKKNQENPTRMQK